MFTGDGHNDNWRTSNNREGLSAPGASDTALFHGPTARAKVNPADGSLPFPFTPFRKLGEIRVLNPTRPSLTIRAGRDTAIHLQGADPFGRVFFLQACTRPASFWAKHPALWLTPAGLVGQVTVACNETVDADTALERLKTKPRKNATILLLREVIAASRNVAQGAEPPLENLLETARLFLCDPSDPELARLLARALKDYNPGKVNAPACGSGAGRSGSGSSSQRRLAAVDRSEIRRVAPLSERLAGLPLGEERHPGRGNRSDSSPISVP